MQRFFASLAFLAMVAVSDSSATNTTHMHNPTLTGLTTASSPIYPPPGLLDSLSSMRLRDDLYQSQASELSKHAMRGDLYQAIPVLPSSEPLNIAVLASISSVFPTRLLPSLDTAISLFPTPSGLDTAILTSIESVFRTLVLSSATPPIVIATAPPLQPSSAFPGSAVAPVETPSGAPQLHVAISTVWMIVITFLIYSMLISTFGSLGNAILVVLVLNVVTAQLKCVDAHPGIHPYTVSVSHPFRRPIGGLRPGPEGKIPCGNGVPKIGEKRKGAGFLRGVHRKIGGLKPALSGELMCDAWDNAHFGRAVSVIATPPSDDEDLSTALYTTKTSTRLVSVPTLTATVSTYKIGIVPPSATSSKDAPYSVATETSISEPPPYNGSPSETLSSRQVSSAPQPALNTRISTSFYSLVLLYPTVILLCLLLGGSSYALSMLLITFMLAAIIAGAEAAAMPPLCLRHAPLYRIGGLKLAGGKPIAETSKSTNRTLGVTPEIGDTGLKKLCGEVFCHNFKWSSFSNVSQSASSPSIVTLGIPKPTSAYAHLAKRLSTLYITVPPTSGIIEIQGPQIIPVTVVSTAYADVVETTVGVVTERSTRTRTAPAGSTQYIMPGTSPLENGLKTVMSGETTSKVAPTPASSIWESKAPTPPSIETVFLTTTYTPPLSLPSSSSPFQISQTLSSTAAPKISNLPVVSSGTHLELNTLYLSFVATNLYCLIFLFIGLNIALTMSQW